MKDPRLRELLENATVGLKDDPELRLDVQQELASHIETAAEEYQANGMDEEESWNAALKDFGGPVDLAQSLVEGNKRRMKLRGSLRLAFRALVMPLGLVSAVWISFEGFQSGSVLLSTLLSIFSPPSSFIPKDCQLTRSPLKKEEKLLLWGDRTRDTRAEQQHALVELDPKNVIYYGNYVTCLWAESQPEQEGDAEGKKQLLHAAREGTKLEPNNARYDYMEAAILLQDACELTKDEEAGTDSGRPTPWRLDVRDRRVLDQAMAKYLQGVDKPFWSAHSSEMMALRLAVLPPPKDLGEVYVRVALSAAILFPDLAHFGELTRASISYGELLLREGGVEEAEPFLTSWLPFSLQISEASSTLIEQLVAFSILQIGQDEALPVLREVEEEKWVDKISLAAQEMLQCHQEFQRRREENQEIVSQLAKERGSILDALLLPALGLGEEELKLETGRLLDQTILERMGLLLFTALFLLVLGFTFLAALRWRKAPGARSAPLLLLPKGRDLLFTLVFSVVVPLGLFFIYTRWSGLAGREYGVAKAFPRFFAELFVLSEVILLVAVRRSMGQLRERCVTLGVVCPKELRLWQIALLLLLPVAWFTWLVRGPQEFGAYKGTLARSLLPVLCLVLLLTGLVCHPYLHRRERDLLQASEYLPVLSEDGSVFVGFTRPEAELVARLKREVLEVAARHPSVFEKDG